MSQNISKIKNVFISKEKNNLQLVDIHFKDKIIDVIPVYDQIYKWNDISTNQKKQKLFTNKSYKLQENEIDGKFNLLIPGGIDSHVHFNTPGYEFRDDFEHGSLAAAAGGTTTVIDMPCTSSPPITSKENFLIKENVLINRSLIDYMFWGGIRGNDFNDLQIIKKQIEELIECGVAGFKVYLTSGMDSFRDITIDQFKSIFDLLKNQNISLAIHAEDKTIVSAKTSLYQSQNLTDWKAYCNSRNVQCEVEAIEDIISVIDNSKLKVHIVHLSSRSGLELINQAKSEGKNISTETCPHYLFFTQKDFENPEIANFLKTAPPVKFEEDKEALWNGLKDRSISFITTDHAGCNPLDEKSSSNFWNIYGGIPGVQHRVEFLFSEGFLQNKIDLETTIKLLSTNVAKHFNIHRKGKIEKGYDADFAIIDLWDSKIIKHEDMLAKGKYTPFNDIKFNAIIQKSILRGNLIYNIEEEIEPNYSLGKLIKLNA